MIWPDLRDPEVVEEVAQSDEHRRLMDDADYNSAAVVPLDRPRAHDRRALLPARQPRPALRRGRPRLPRRARRQGGDGARQRPPLPRPRPRSPPACRAACARPSRPRSRASTSRSSSRRRARESRSAATSTTCIPTEDGCWVLIGDVAGKGSAAAGVSVAVRHAVRGLARVVDEPDEVLARVNELLLGGDSLNDFATATLVRMRREAGAWRVVLGSAGHPPAIHLGPAGPTPLGGGAILGGWADADGAAPRADPRRRPDARPLHRRLARGRPAARSSRAGGAGGQGALALRRRPGGAHREPAQGRPRPRRRSASRRPRRPRGQARGRGGDGRREPGLGGGRLRGPARRIAARSGCAASGRCRPDR